MNSGIERRRKPRYQLGAGAIAVSANTPGHIQNISMGGISFVYLLSEEPSSESETVDILDGENEFFLLDIPCRVVSKRKLIKESSFSMLRMMQCSLEFGALTKPQQVELEAYMQTQAKGVDLW